MVLAVIIGEPDSMKVIALCLRGSGTERCVPSVVDARPDRIHLCTWVNSLCHLFLCLHHLIAHFDLLGGWCSSNGLGFEFRLIQLLIVSCKYIADAATLIETFARVKPVRCRLGRALGAFYAYSDGVLPNVLERVIGNIQRSTSVAGSCLNRRTSVSLT